MEHVPTQQTKQDNIRGVVTEYIEPVMVADGMGCH